MDQYSCDEVFDFVGVWAHKSNRLFLLCFGMHDWYARARKTRVREVSGFDSHSAQNYSSDNAVKRKINLSTTGEKLSLCKMTLFVIIEKFILKIFLRRDSFC